MNQTISFTLQFFDTFEFENDKPIPSKELFIEYMKRFNFTEYETLVKKTCLEDYPCCWTYDNYYQDIYIHIQREDNCLKLEGMIDFSKSFIDVSCFKEFKETLSFAMYIVKDFFSSSFFLLHLNDEQLESYFEKCTQSNKNLNTKIAFDNL